MTRRALTAVLAMTLAACATHPPPTTPAPKFTDFPPLTVPASLRIAPDLQERFDLAVRVLQTGDFRAANRAFADVLKRSPSFYPAETGLGYAALADRQFKPASVHFAAALTENDQYVPALLGQADAQLGLRNDIGALGALEQVLKIDPSRQALRTRIDVLRLRVVQGQLEAARRDREAGRLDEAQADLERALESAPANSVLIRELAVIETARGVLDPAEAHARSAVQLDAGDPESHAVLGAVLEAKGRHADAADAYARAMAIEPRPEWRQKIDALRSQALAASIPPEYRAIPTAMNVTRAQVAAMIGLQLGDLLDRAPKRVTVVATDIRGHWAAAWIVKVTQADIMDVFPNHTFQPGTLLRRSDLAAVVVQLLPLAMTRRADELAHMKAEKPAFPDLAMGHVSYRGAALAVSSGAMALDQGRFWPNRAASGADLIAAINRVTQLAGR